MKAVSVLFVLCLIVVLSACGGSPTSPSTPYVPPTPVNPGIPTQPTPQPPSSSSALKINPENATMAVGQSMIFTASGGDGWNYSFSAGPYGVLDWDQASFNTVRVTLVDKSGFSSGWVNVMGYDQGLAEKTIVVQFR